MRIFDLEDPTLPQLIGSYSSFEGYNIGHVHDAFVRNDTAYLNCGNDGLVIVDFEDVENPNTIAILSTEDYPQSGYNHSGWLSENGEFYIMADETHGKDMKMMDVRNLPEISTIATLNPDSHELQIPHNQIIMGNYLYVSYYYDGLQIWDMTDPINPIRSHYFDTSEIPHVASYHGAWGIYPFLPSGNILVSDLQEGLFIIKGIETEANAIEHLNETRQVELYPNPVNDKLHVSDISLNDVISIKIYNSIGIEFPLHRIDQNDAQIDVSISAQLPHGVYYMKIETTQQISTGKFVKL